MLVCPQCFSDSAALKARFDERGAPGTCEGCNAESENVLDASELRDLFDGLQKQYEPVFDQYRYGKEGIQGYEPGAADDSLSQVMTEDWDVFSDALEDPAREGILQAVWPDYFGAYMSKGTDSDRKVGDHWKRLKCELMHEWRYFRDGGEGQEFLERWLEPFIDELRSDLGVAKSWRVRIQDPEASAFTPAEMGAPPASRATGGRANASGIPHLYVASLEETAVAEVRAEPGDWVTVAEVTIGKLPLKVLDLTKDVRIIDPFAHSDLETAIVTRELLQIFANELSRPVRAADPPLEYVVTQFLSEYFRRSGFDGIHYPSALVSRGTNAVFFDPSVAMIGTCVRRAVLSKTVQVVDEREFEKHQRRRRGLSY